MPEIAQESRSSLAANASNAMPPDGLETQIGVSAHVTAAVKVQNLKDLCSPSPGFYNKNVESLGGSWPQTARHHLTQNQPAEQARVTCAR